jgi:hypothetical protein
LRNKSYCLFNKQLTKEEYQNTIKQFDLGSETILGSLKDKFTSKLAKYISPALIEHHSSNVTGNWTEESANVASGFQCLKVKDGKYLLHIVEAEDVMDYSFWGIASERIYETINSGRQLSNVLFCNESWDSVVDVRYSMNCHSSQDLFGCIGLRNKQHCILNTQYSKEEYEELIPKIVEHMNAMPYVDKKGRRYGYGEFFPPELSPFAYNETIAQEYFPLGKEEMLDGGYRHKESEERDYKVSVAAGSLPDNINDAEGGITAQTIGCLHEGTCNHFCTKAFKITDADLQFYKQIKIPLPRLCPNCRHYQRLTQRNPLKLWHRKCQCAGSQSDPSAGSEQEAVYRNVVGHFHGSNPCPNEFETSYPPDRSGIVYCLQCYNAEVV